MPLATQLAPAAPTDYIKIQFELAYPGLAIDALPDAGGVRWLAYSPHLTGFQLAAVLQLMRDLETVSELPANQVKEAEFVAMLERLNEARAPYLIRYLLQSTSGISDDRFDAYRHSIQGPGMRLLAGHTQQHRYRAIERELLGGGTLVDIGCGKAYYLRRLAGRYQQAWGYEADPDVRRLGTLALNSHGVKGVKIHGAFTLDKWIPETAHVLVTEVLEHIPRADATAWLGHLGQQPAGRLVLTVPNQEFNQYYGLTDGTRHPGHQWEPTFAEFQALVSENLGDGWDLRVVGIGDSVDGIFASTMCVATRRPARDTSGLRS